MSSANILVVDDEDSIRHFVSRSLKDEGYQVRSAGDGDAARALFNEDVPDVVILDMKLGDTNGLDLLSEFKQVAPDTVVIVITAFGETETAVRAMSLGAFYFLKKPLQLEELNTIVGRGFEKMWDRGRAFGELLNHGDDEALATLALAEIVCAPMLALQALAPSLKGEPLMVLIETDVVPARVRALDVELPQPEHWGRRRLPEGGLENYLEQERRSEDQTIGLRMTALSRLLHEGLRATPQMLLDRAAQAQARLGARGAAVSADAGPVGLERVSARTTRGSPRWSAN